MFNRKLTQFSSEFFSKFPMPWFKPDLSKTTSLKVFVYSIFAGLDCYNNKNGLYFQNYLPQRLFLLYNNMIVWN